METQDSRIKQVGLLESLLFASDKPLMLKEVSDFLGLSPKETQGLLKELQAYYHQNHRGFFILEVAQGYKLTTNPLYASELSNFFSFKKKRRLSQNSLEVLAIIAYRQPITKREIEIIRGQSCDGTIKSLIHKGLIKIRGRKRAPGRPFLYKVTDKFLESFGLKSLKDLPPLKDKEIQDGLKDIS